MRDGTEAEIVGGFKFGLTEDFKKVLAASRQIKVVHLDSVGGRAGEGRMLYELIRDRGLSTYVSSKCMSACTVAFAAGRERASFGEVHPLDFIEGHSPGTKERELDSAQADIFRKAGFDAKFIQTAMSTPHKDMWKPSEDVLLEEAGGNAAIRWKSVRIFRYRHGTWRKKKWRVGSRVPSLLYRRCRSGEQSNLEAWSMNIMVELSKGKPRTRRLISLR